MKVGERNAKEEGFLRLRAQVASYCRVHNNHRDLEALHGKMAILRPSLPQNTNQSSRAATSAYVMHVRPARSLRTCNDLVSSLIPHKPSLRIPGSLRTIAE